MQYDAVWKLCEKDFKKEAENLVIVFFLLWFIRPHNLKDALN